jgi:hypothetical protein
MPNWCQNVVTFEHKDFKQVEKLATALKEGKLMQTFRPCPEELSATMAGRHGDPEAQKALEEQEKRNLETYGHSNWYDWCVHNWGTKWDVGVEDPDEVQYSEEEPIIQVGFDSAWGPPVAFYMFMEEQGWEIDAYFHESGMGFCGRYHKGKEDNYEIEADADWVRENIPKEIDDIFCISEGIESWEDDEDDDSDT